jgi:hypothetical protein
MPSKHTEPGWQSASNTHPSSPSQTPVQRPLHPSLRSTSPHSLPEQLAVHSQSPQVDVICPQSSPGQSSSSQTLVPGTPYRQPFPSLQTNPGGQSALVSHSGFFVQGPQGAPGKPQPAKTGFSRQPSGLQISSMQSSPASQSASVEQPSSPGPHVQVPPQPSLAPHGLPVQEHAHVPFAHSRPDWHWFVAVQLPPGGHGHCALHGPPAGQLHVPFVHASPD